MKNIYIASCAPDGGVYLCDFSDEKLSVKEFYHFDRPMFLAPENDRLYIELRQTDGNFSGIQKSDIGADGQLSGFGEPISTKGIVACHLCVHGNDVFCTNYLSGSVSKLDFSSGSCIKTDVHSGVGVHPTRQEAPHTHFITETPDGKYLASTDLGLDTVFIYDFDLNVISTAKVPSGHGARHLVFSHNAKRMYCANELRSTVSVFAYDDGHLSLLGTYDGLPKSFHGESTAAAIRLSDDGKYLYMSNRGHDSITVFAVCGDSLTPLSYTPSGGKGPRDFNICDGYLFCTNEGTGNVTVFKCDDEKLIKLDTELEIKNALCVVFK